MPLRESARSLQVVGQLVINFTAVRPCSALRSTESNPLAPEPSAEFLIKPPTSTWKGFPLAEIKGVNWHLWLLGEFYGQSCAELGQNVLGIVSGERPATQLNGHFLLWAREEASRKWHVWTDRFGTLHAYHARHGNSVALGTSFDAVAGLASNRQLDWTALTGFFGFGFFPEDRTFYEDVRILRPATHYVFSAKGEEISAKRYWNWNHTPDGNRSYDDTVDEFGHLFGTVMGGLLKGGRIALPISGGLDSRSTIACVNSPISDLRSPISSGVSPTDPGRLWSYSYGYTEDSVETRISQQVAAARGLPFAPFTIQPYLFDHLDQILGAVEGFQDITQCRQAFVADELGKNADCVIAAHWGDVWLDDMGLSPASADGRQKMEDGNPPISDLRSPIPPEQVLDHTLKKMAKRGRAWLLENLCMPQLGKESAEGLLLQFVKTGLDRLEHIEDPDFRVKAFKTDHWSFRWTLSSIRMFQAAAFPRLPFYDTRLTDFFGTVPSAFLSGRKLQVDYLKRFAPDLARIEWQAHGTNLYRYQDTDTWQLPKRAVKKALRLITGKKIIERNWEVQFGGEQGLAGLNHWLLRPGLRLHDLVTKAKVEQLLCDFRADPLKDGRGYTVSMLLTFSAWLERQG